MGVYKMLVLNCQKMLEINCHFLPESTCRLQRTTRGRIRPDDTPSNEGYFERED